MRCLQASISVFGLRVRRRTTSPPPPRTVYLVAHMASLLHGNTDPAGSLIFADRPPVQPGCGPPSGGLSPFPGPAIFINGTSQADPFDPAARLRRPWEGTVSPTIRPPEAVARHHKPPGTGPPHANDVARTPPIRERPGHFTTASDRGDKFFEKKFWRRRRRRFGFIGGKESA